VDDIVIKSKQIDQLVDDLAQTFAKLRMNGVRLNLEKFDHNHHQNGPGHNLKGVQRVIGCLAALGRFILRLRERGLFSLSASEKDHSLHVDPRGSGGT
jgi:hypothetical protein